MSVMFTQQAIERMRQRDITTNDMGELLKVVERMADNPSDLGRSEEAVHVKWQRGEEAFIIRVGDMRAVVTIDPDMSHRLIVMSIYRASQDRTQANSSLASAAFD